MGGGHRTVHTDCEAAKAGYDNGTANVVKFNPHWVLATAMHQARTVPVLKVKAHPERFKNSAFYTTEDWGITFADTFAAGSGQDAVLTIQEALSIATKNMQYVLVYKEDDSVAADDILDRRDRMRLEGYIACRDRNRVERGLKAKWGDVNPGLGTTMLSKGMTPGIMGQSFIVRLMWAWHWIGYNRVKGPKAKVEDGACPLCGEFEDIEHILRSCKDPEMCRYRKETWKQLEQFLRFAVDGKVCSAADKIVAYAASDPVQAKKHKGKLAKREEKGKWN